MARSGLGATGGVRDCAASPRQTETETMQISR